MTDVFIMAPLASRRVLLQSILQQDSAIHIVGMAPSFAFLRSLLNETEVDVAVVDIENVVEPRVLQEWLTELVDLIPLVLLSPRPDPIFFSIVAQVSGGGLLALEASAEQIVQAVKAVAAGLVTLDPTFVPRPEPSGETPEALTAREHEVLALLAEGLPNREIASRLQISEHTIKFHVRSILGKLGASSRTEAVSRGLRSGLIEL